MKKALAFATLISASLILGSCASILNGKNQKVTIHSPIENATVYVDNKEVGKGKTVVAKMLRDTKEKQIRIEKEGYKPIYKVHYQTSKSPLYIMSVIPFGVLWIPIFTDFGPKAFNYKKEVTIDETPIKITKRTNEMKYVYLKNTAFDVKSEDLKVKLIKNKNFKKGKDKSKELVKSDEDIKFDNSIFSDAVYSILKENNYVDTTKTILKSKTNSLYISAKISKIDFENVYAIHARSYMNFLVTTAVIEWEIMDIYDQSKFKKQFKSKSGEFVINGKESANASLEDAINNSFFQLMQIKEVNELLKLENNVVEKFDALALKADKTTSNLEEALHATVTIKKKSGHGSGCIISNDGYIVTNFHVVAGNEEFTVVDGEGKEYKATLIRKSEELDLALIKVASTFAHAFKLVNNKNYSIGDDIYVAGTPASLELSQTLTKGIISGNRKSGTNTYIQLDASVNSGNSGGALVKKTGEFVGVINSKIIGFGMEGLGFSIPADRVIDGLNISN